MARLRNRRFFSLAALNEAIHALLVDLNNRPLRSWGEAGASCSRSSTDQR
ncbi:hypothetical protein [Bradyrhizobium shewense]|nr:hypothetical protein [Bradyrhizobium shewense]